MTKLTIARTQYADIESATENERRVIEELTDLDNDWQRELMRLRQDEQVELADAESKNSAVNE